MILHIFNVEGDSCAFGQSFKREIEPATVIIFGMICSNPNIILCDEIVTLVREFLEAWEQLPESKSESMMTLPKVKVLWDGGLG